MNVDSAILREIIDAILDHVEGKEPAGPRLEALRYQLPPALYAAVLELAEVM